MALSGLILRCLILLALLCPALPAVAQQPEVVRLQLKWRHQFQFAGFYVAQAKGFYREAGLDVRFLEASGSDTSIDVVTRGNAEFGLHGSDLVVARALGKPVVALAAIFQHSPMVLITRRDRGIDNLHELAGKRVALAPDAAELLAYLRREGVPVALLPAGHNFSLDDLISGRVDARPAYLTNEPYALRQARIPYNVFSPRSAGLDFYGDVLFTSEAWLRAHRKQAAAFIEASRRGWYYALSHRDEAVDLVRARYAPGLDHAHLDYEAGQISRLMAPEFAEVGQMSEGRWRHIADTFAEIGMMPVGFDLEGFLYDRQAHHDYRPLYWALAAASLAALLAGLVGFYYRRLNRALQKEISERRRLQDNLENLANTDALTGLPNRRYFLEHLNIENYRHERYGRPLSVMMLDLDHFKRINDNYGHVVGDEALHLFAETLCACLRAEDVPARMGGEEFAVLLPESGREAVWLVAERIRSQVADLRLPVGADRLQFTVSIGVAEVGGHEDVLAILRRADGALYEAKAAGRNRVVVASPVAHPAARPGADEAN